MKTNAAYIVCCKILLGFLLLIVCSPSAFAQTITNYTFVASTGTFTALSGATSIALTTGTTDDGTFNAVPVGFDYWYMGVRYTTISASTNGWLSPGSTITDDNTNGLSTRGTRPLIAPLWDDLDIVTAANVTYLTTGTAGSRIFTIQYLNVKWNYLASGSVSSFQVKIYEATGKIEFVYRADAVAVNTPTASIGITALATGSGNFLSVSNTGVVSSTTEANVTTKPVSGRTYDFTPLTPTAPANLTFSTITTTSTTLNWTDNSSNEIGFVIYRSTDGTNYSFVSQTAAGATSSVQSGLSGSTTYYWKVYAVTEGRLSTALSGSQASACTGPNISQLPASNLIAYYKLEGNANDATGNDNGTLQGSPSTASDRFGNANKAYSFNGTSQYISTANTYVNPAAVSVSIRFRTTTTVGGTLIGFSSVQTGSGGSRDRFIYMTGTGILYFGVAPGAVKKYVNTTLAYNDGNWHMATGTVGAGGLKLYVDGILAATDATTTSAETTTGYWRIGYDDLATWPSEPTSYYFAGILDDAIIYHRELTSTEVGVLYNSPDGAGSNAPVCVGSALNLTSTTVAGATYAWSGPNGFTSASQNPGLTYTVAYAGVYTVQVSTSGCASPSVAYVNVTTPASNATISYAGSPYCTNAGTASVTLTGAAGGTYSSTAGLSVNATTGVVNLAASTAGSYTVTYAIAGGCSTTTTIVITTAAAATIIYSGTPYCSSAAIATVTFTGTTGGTYTSAAGLVINAATGEVNLSASTAGSYTVTYTIPAIGACAIYMATAAITVKASPAISQLPVTSLTSYYKFEGNANDATGNNNGTLQNTPAPAVDRFGVANSAYTLNGSSQYISTKVAYVDPTDFTASIWFKTATTTGGKLIGFGREQLGSSGQFDRHIYMNNAGQIYFGIYSGGIFTVNSSLSYNDNNWHLATASLSSTAGMVLYVDGIQVGSNASATAGENYTGYWKIGFDNLSGWTSSPTSNYFTGVLDDALIYLRALNASEVAILYKSPDGAGNNGPACAGTSVSLSATTVPGATYAWTGPNSFTSATANPSFTYTAVNNGTYKLQVSAAGCTSTAYTNLASSANAGQWTGNVSTDWAVAGNWCTGVVPASTVNVTISASATRMPTVSSSVSCNNLTIDAGATITTAAAGTLHIGGLLTNNGTFTSSGTTDFNGSAGQQTYSGISQFYNLTVSNTSGLLLSAAITVNNTLTIAAGTLNANNFNIAVKGNWVNNVSTAALTAGTSTVTFNGTTAQSIGGTFATTFNNLIISNTGNTISLLVNTIIDGNLSIAAGTFDLAAFTANRSAAGGVLLISTNATLKIGGTNTFPSNYTTNTLVVSSTVEYAGVNQAVSNQIYGNLKLSSSVGTAVKTFPGTALSVIGNLTTTLGTGTSVSFTAAAAITVSGNVNIGASTTFNGGSFAHSIAGNWLNSGTFTGSTGTIIFTGVGATVDGSGAQNFNNLTVAASSVSFSNAGLTLTGNLATTGSGSFSQVSGGTLTMSGSGKTISGSAISLDNLTVSGTVTTAATFILTGNLSVSGSFTATNGAITMSGASKSIAGAGTIGFSNLLATGVITTSTNFSVGASLNVNGSFTASAGTATFTGTSSLSGTANLYNTTINGTSLQLAANSTLGIASLLTISAGSLDVSSTVPNTVNFNSAGAQNINNITYNDLILSNGNNKTATGAITVNSDITIGTGTTFIPGAYTHICYSNWINNGTFTAGSGTITFMGTATTNITGATTFNILTINNATSAAAVILQSNVSAAIVNMISGTMYTGPNTLTITTTRTGNGIIIGTIQRTHAFTTGVAYAFEGPVNTITFASLSGITSVTVNVSENTPGDFPFGGSITRVYNVTVPTGTYNATLRLHYEDAELNGNNEASMGLWHYSGTIWGATGKTGNDASLNYVEQSGLTNITNRWTLSDNSNVVQWNGSVSTDWNTAANWTVLQGAASRPPAATDIVNLGNTTFTFHPTISTAVTVKNIVFGSTQALNLSLTSGGSLNSGTINGVWTSNVTHSINANNQAITIYGDLALSDGTTGHAINLNAGTGAVSVLGSLTESGGANITFSSAGALNILENFNYSSGTFTAGSSTVVYNGTINQTVAAVAYNNLTINKTSGLANINNPLSVGSNLVISGGELDNFSTTSILGNVTISSGTTFQNSDTLHVGGNWINNGSYLAEGGNIYFDGTGAQSISPTTFNNLNINKASGTATFSGNVLVNGNFIVSAGTLDLQIYTCTRTIRGGVLSVADGATLIIGGVTADPQFSVLAYSIASTVIFNGVNPQTLFLPGVSMGNLILRNAGAKTLGADFTIKGNLTIDSATTFNATSHTISLEGNWINNGTFIPGTGTVLLNGASKTITGNTTFNKVTISGSYTQIATTVTYNDLLYITPTGSISGGSTISTILNGDLLNKGTLNTSGTTTFTGLQLQTLSLIDAVTFALTVNFNGTVSPVQNSTSAPQFGFLNINNTGGISASVGYTIVYGLTVGTGASFNGGPSTHNILGSVSNNGTITSNGTLNFIPSSAVSVNLGSNFSSTGTVVFGGAGALTLSGTPVAFHDVLISNSNAAGITASSGWNLSNRFTINSGAIFNAGTYTDSVGGNILINGILNGGTSTFVLNGTGNQDISSGSAFNNFTINKTTGAANLLTNATVNGVLNFVAGNISTGANQVVLPSSGTVSGAAQNKGWVYGNLKKNIATGATSQTYEIGDATNYTPVAIAFSNVSTAGNLNASTTAGEHPDISSSVINPAASVNRYWTLTNSGIVFNNYSGTFNFKAADIDAGSITTKFGIGLYNGSSWVMPAMAVVAPTSSQATGISSFGSFAVGEICNAGTGIAYTASTYCTNAGIAAVTLTGTSGGTYSSTTGLSLNAATGSVTLASSIAGTYSVTYTVAASGSCATYITTANITITNAPNATISYTGSPYYTGSGTAAVTFSGTPTGGIYSSTTGLSINAVTGNVTLASSTAGTYTVTYTVAAAGGCGVYTTTASITVTSFKTWDGGAGTNNWEDAANWLPDGVPTAAENVQLTGTNTININTNAVAANLVINSGGLILTISTGTLAVNNITVTTGILNINTNTIKIAGSITNTGTFAVDNGTVEMNGSSAQVIPAGAFTGNTLNGLKISNSAGVTLNGTLNLTGVLLANGPLNTGGYLTLISSAVQTALIDGAGSGEVQGVVAMQRYLLSGFGYKYFSSPFVATTVNEFSNDINLSASFPVFYRYNENLPSSGWVDYTDKTGLLDVLQGYTANLGVSSAPKTISLSGVVNNNTISPLTLYNHNQPYTLGFNLIGNPYPSPVDWDLSAGWSRTNIDDAVYYFDAGTTDIYTGTYSSYINGVSSNGIAGNVIAAMQGFFVHVSDGTFPVTAALTTNNSARLNNLVANFHRDPAPVTAPLLRITAGFSDKRIITDPVVVYFDKKATRAFEPAMDALKLMNTDSLVPNLYVLSSNTTGLSICAWPAMEDSSDVIPLGLQTKQTGFVTFNTTNIERIPAGKHIYLYDAKTGVRQDLQLFPQYRLLLDAGKYENRFSLVFNKGTDVPASAGIFDAYGAGSKMYAHISEMPDEKCDVTVTNMSGQIILRTRLYGNGYHELGSQFSGGVYIVNFYVKQPVISKKVFISN
jgi:hypothetical protein